MNYFSLIKHDLQVNNVASEICTEYGTQGIQNSEWKETIVAHCKRSNQNGLMIDLSLKARLNSTKQLCESLLSGVNFDQNDKPAQNFPWKFHGTKPGSCIFHSQKYFNMVFMWFLCSILDFHEKRFFFLSVSMRRYFSHTNYIWCFRFPSSVKLQCFITPLKSEIAD